jgi:hypothetical protein
MSRGQPDLDLRDTVVSDLTQFDRQSAARIARVVRAVEGEPQQAKPLTFGVVDPAQKKTFRACTYTGQWSIDSDKVVTFLNRTTLPNTVSARNLTFHLPVVGTATAFECHIARDGTAWYLVSAEEHNVKTGTFSGAWANESSKTVTLASGGTVSVKNRFASLIDAGERKCTIGRDGMEWDLIEVDEPFIRIGAFTGTWAKSTTKTIDLQGTTATVSALNLFAAVPASGSCAIARDGTAWYLIAAECG